MKMDCCREPGWKLGQTHKSLVRGEKISRTTSTWEAGAGASFSIASHHQTQPQLSLQRDTLPFEPALPRPKMSFVPVNPRPMLQGLVDKDIVVRLKWGETEYKGKLVSLDSYLNLQLSGTVEYINDKPTGELGQVLIRYGRQIIACMLSGRARTDVL